MRPRRTFRRCSLRWAFRSAIPTLLMTSLWSSMVMSSKAPPSGSAKRGPLPTAPVNPQLPPSLHTSVAFSATEDLLAEPMRAGFGLPLNQPLSPGRTKTLVAFNTQYQRVSWRVRAVTGSGVASPWSPYVTQGPAPGGVDG